MAEELRKLREQNKILQTRLEQYEAAANNRLVSVRNENATPAAAGSGAGVRSLAPSATRESDTLRAATSTSRTHTVAPGETPVAIAKRYGIRVEALMAANPRLEPRRMRVGQAVSIPAS